MCNFPSGRDMICNQQQQQQWEKENENECMFQKTGSCIQRQEISGPETEMGRAVVRQTGRGDEQNMGSACRKQAVFMSLLCEICISINVEAKSFDQQEHAMDRTHMHCA